MIVRHGHIVQIQRRGKAGCSFIQNAACSVVGRSEVAGDGRVGNICKAGVENIAIENTACAACIICDQRVDEASLAISLSICHPLCRSLKDFVFFQI